jgi:hypothetical protein
MSRNTSVLTKFILDTAFGLPGIILFGLLGGIAVGLAVGRSANVGASLPEKPDISLLAAPIGLDGPALVQLPAVAEQRSPGTAKLRPALAIDYGRGTALLIGPLVPRAGVSDGTQIAKAAACPAPRGSVDHN